MIRAVCFDMDGVLFDTEARGGDVRRCAAQAQGLSLTQEQHLSIRACTMRRARAQLSGWFPGFDPRRFMDDWYRLMRQEARRELPFKPHAAQTLRSLRRRGVRIALTSSNAPWMVEDYLRLSGIEPLFDLVLHGGDVTRSKPDPEIYLLAAQRLGLEPSQCAGVEDAPSGVEAVRRAGMLSVMVPDLTAYSEDVAPFVDVLIPDLSHLEAALFGGAET